MPPDAPSGLCPQCLLQSATIASSPGGGGKATITTSRPSPGGTYGGYRILRLLGRGGMGEVFEADQLESGRRVALKVMNHSLTSETDRKRFLREGRLAASVSHPNVIYVYGSEEIAGAPVIAMELIHEGTLKDIVKKRGPLPVGEAVDYVLQVIAGLEAANATGVLHRDIKPTNCFVGADGTVKVGDFGLSISTLARQESMVTATGSVLGTPSLASPEQLRGEELDVRSDIYSVGATLYYLLTGKLPFQAEDLVKLIATVLDQPPDSPLTHRPDLPAELVRIISRCLAKDRKQRFADYAELARTLQPFSSAVARPANLGLRFVATLVDGFVAAIPSFATLAWMGQSSDEVFLAERNWGNGLLLAGQWLFAWMYFAICEGLWGAGLGKSLCGLRVVRPDGSVPGVPRALARALVFELPAIVPFLMLLSYSEARYQLTMDPSQFYWIDWLPFGILAVLLCTMRRRNGFAAVHDFVTGTRVVAVEERELRVPVEVPPSPESSQAGELRVGPYRIKSRLAQADGASLWLGHDEALRREVWIHRVPAGAEPVAARRRELSRATRLRWLNGRRDGDDSWDAYEAPEGRPLVELLRKPQPWRTVRFWLHDLAEEFHAGNEPGGKASGLELERAWVRRNGPVVMLDFPAPGAGEAGMPALPAATDLPSLQSLLAHVADVSLKGSEDKGRLAEGPRTVSGQSFVERMQAGAFDSLELLLGNLRSLIHRPAATSSRLRISAVLVAAVPALVFGGMMYVTMSKSMRAWDEAWARQFPGQPSLRHALAAEVGAFEPHAVRSLTLYTGREFAGVLTNETFWSHPHLGRTLMDHEREFLTNALAEAQSATDIEHAGKRGTAEQMIRKWAGVDQRHAMNTGFLMFAGWLLLGMGASFVSVLIIGQPPLLKLMGLAVVNRHGRPVSRRRAVWRWLLAWLPVGLMLLLGLLAISPDTGPTARSLRHLLFINLAGLMAVLSELESHPWRVWFEKLSGTYVVPR